MKIPENKELFIIADCVEGDYKLYRPLYKKLAKRNHIDPNDIYIITSERIRNLKLNKMGQPFKWMNSKVFLKLLLESYKKVYFLCNVKRVLEMYEYFGNYEMDNAQCFGYYTDVAVIRDHPLSKEVATNCILSNGTICTTSLLPNKEYLDNLDFIIKHVREHGKGLIRNHG